MMSPCFSPEALADQVQRPPAATASSPTRVPRQTGRWIGPRTAGQKTQEQRRIR